MPTYVILYNFTNQGIRNVKDSPKRAKTFDTQAKKVGIKVKELYWTNGRYDVVAICEAPNDEVITRELLRVTSLGNVRTETLRAFAPKEMDRILKGMRTG